MLYQAFPPAGSSCVLDRPAVNEDAYAVVYAWMVTRLGLKGASLFIYASIYGFTQSIGCFSAGVKYLLSWTGVSRAQVYRVLSALEKQGILVSYKRWDGHAWGTVYAAFRTKEEADAYKAACLLAGDPEKNEGQSDTGNSAPPSAGGRTPARKPVRKAEVRHSARDKAPGVAKNAVPSSGRKAVSAAPPAWSENGGRIRVPSVDSGGLQERMYEMWLAAGLLNSGVTKDSFSREFQKAMANVRNLRINCVDLEAAAKNYIDMMSIPPEGRWWTARLGFESFTRRTVERFLPGRFELDAYRSQRARGSPGVSECSSEFKVMLDF